MLSFLVLYGTGEGQTAKVADRVVAVLGERGHDATAVDVATAPADLAVSDYDAVVVGSSIHAGTHGVAVREFVDANRAVLDERPTAFVQVCLSSATDDPERNAEAAGYVEAFVAATGWEPDRVVSVGGALRYSEYGFLKRAMMKRIAKDATGDTDTSRDYEYTDWEEVEAFAADFAALVEGTEAVTHYPDADPVASDDPDDAPDAPEAV